MGAALLYFSISPTDMGYVSDGLVLNDGWSISKPDASLSGTSTVPFYTLEQHSQKHHRWSCRYYR